MIADAGPDVLKACVDLFCSWNRTALKHGRWPQFSLSFHVSLQHPIDSALPLGMGSAKNFIKNMQINTKTFHVVFDGCQTEINQVNMVAVDQNVVAREISVRQCLPVQPTYGAPNTLQDAFDILFADLRRIEYLDQWLTGEQFNDELAKLET